MSQFEVIALTLSFVLGLSMSHMLWSAAAAVRARKHLQLHWLPFLWAGCIFFVHIQYWFAALAIDRVIIEWTWSWYLHMLFLGILLFASGALVLPSESQQRSGKLLDDFKEHGRLGLIPLAAYHLFWIPTAYRMDQALFDAGNYANLVLAVFVIIGLISKRQIMQWASVFGFALVVIWASVFLWTGGSL
ncbi:MAG: hypothetical protein PVF17_08265 [Ignavibacteria bacterium]|jgi:hypothetical protein